MENFLMSIDSILSYLITLCDQSHGYHRHSHVTYGAPVDYPRHPQRFPARTANVGCLRRDLISTSRTLSI